ncbi:universal stress protein [Streptomyces clavuligerus]|nr:universal stress protein [Streptomyces clavuligerus]ANW21547.1 stress protein [Streptomyces clavuligerus]AXU16177.1 universal stress protein [Streptomyces clavuligerus]MBY6306327.1 universal stress protein [Streptomyces clavuligerus]QCS08956.1 universal stress protein [Streptomyces clavuligerus]QPJ91709.1 universal stress protein [Streptomyces clavuligerus]
MSRSVAVGLDGSPESLAAAAWAAEEARLRGLPLRLVSVWESVPLLQVPFMGAETRREESEQLPQDTAAELRARHPGLDVVWEQLTGRPGELLPEAAAEAELLVLGSRGLSGIGGFLLGSVGQQVVARAGRPVVLVRAAADGHTGRTGPAERDGATAGRGEAAEGRGGAVAGPGGAVVLGLDANAPDDGPIMFAFEAAARRGTALRVVHGWSLPPYFAYGLPPDPELNEELGRAESAVLQEALRPWRQKYPPVEVIADALPGKAADLLVSAARETDAALLVVGRRIRRATRFGGRIGSVTHAVLHHSTVPVAVVPHP